MTAKAGWLPNHRRTSLIVLAALGVLTISYMLSRELHRSAIGRVNQAREQTTRADWLAATGSLDRALWEDPFLVEAHLLLATAINGHIQSSGVMSRKYSRDDALSHLDWVLHYRPASGEAHYQRGLALAGLARVQDARAELATAIPLLDDPADALVERSGLSFHVGDYKTAMSEVSSAIERHPLVPEYYGTRALYREIAGDPRGARQDRLRAHLLRGSKASTAKELELLVNDQADDQPISEPQDSPAVSAERARLRGTWKVVSRGSHGELIDTADRDFTITFEAGRYHMMLDGKVQQDAPFLLNPKRQPHWIDWKATIRGKEQTVLGLYELNRDTLKICMANAGEARPRILTANDLETAVFYRLRRLGRSPR